MSIRTAAALTYLVFLGVNARAAANSSAPHIPFSFVENRGQADPSVRYIGTGPEFKAWFQDHGVVLRHGRTTVKLVFEGPGAMKGKPGISADNPIGARANYLYGTDPRLWQTDLQLFGSIHYTDIWPGVELTYKAEATGMKAEYLVAAGASVGAILIRCDGGPQIQNDGTLRIHGPSGDFIEDKPLFYQSIRGGRKEIVGGFRKVSSSSVGFWAGDYDHTQALVIDPSILISGYFGGSSEDNITAVGVDSLNNIVTAGWTSSNNLPASHGAQSKYAGSVDAFVASFLPNGGSLNYCTYLGGSGDDRAFALAIDNARNVYITGWTSSVNFPLAGAFQTRLSGTRDAFVAKLNAAGNALVYSTYLGGSGVDAGYAIALTPASETSEPANSVVVVGDTTSSNFPVTIGAFQLQSGGSQDAFVAMLSPAGRTLTFGTYFGGNGVDHASSVQLGSGGAIFIGGYTWSNNFPVLNAYQPVSGGGQDAFVAKLGPAGNKLYWSTYLGGYGGSVGAPEEVNALRIDALSNIVVAGTTSSPNFPVTTSAYQTVFGGQTDGFVARFGNSSGALLQSTYLGGALSDSINALALDFHGNPYVTGSTSSQDFPVQGPLQNTNAGGMDAFAVKLNTTLSSVIFGTYLGGYGSDQANAIAVDGETSIVVAGQTGSGNLPVTGSLQNYMPSVLTSFITKIAPNFTLGVAYGYQGQLEFTADPWHVLSYAPSTFYGEATDLPIVGDWTGSGTKRIGIFRNGTWILDTNGNGTIDASDRTVVFGQAGDIPVVGDWRGTGHIALGLFRQGTFILDLSGHLSGVPTGLKDATYSFGQGGDIPIVADWSGSGTTKVGVFRNGLWLVDYNGDGVFNGLDRSYVYGQAGDFPVVGDWDSSGNPPKIGIYRAGLWVLDYDGDNVWTVPGLNEMSLGFGFAGYTPLVF
jgi:hypothetical protein